MICNWLREKFGVDMVARYPRSRDSIDKLLNAGEVIP
jgi:hypothetical protein